MTEYPNWFNMTARACFESFLLPYKGAKDFRALQIGAYVGHASEWMLRNVLTGKGANLTDVDTWEGSQESAHEAMDWQDVYATYRERVKTWLWTPRLRSVQMPSDRFFALEHMFGVSTFDFAYIDGDHTEAQVYKDAVNAWLCTKPGSIIAFDDYQWGEGAPMELRPKRAIDRFLSEHKGEVDFMEIGWQVWIKRI